MKHHGYMEIHIVTNEILWFYKNEMKQSSF